MVIPHSYIPSQQRSAVPTLDHKWLQHHLEVGHLGTYHVPLVNCYFVLIPLHLESMQFNSRVACSLFRDTRIEYSPTPAR